jgi:hypothetical protein
MTWHPDFKLYHSSGSPLIYHIEYVITTNYPEDNPDSVLLTNLRSSRGIVIPGGDKPYELRLRGILIGTDYTDLQSQIAEMKSLIVYNTPYILKIDTSISTQDTINVIRRSPIIFDEGRRTKTQYYTLTFLANSW